MSKIIVIAGARPNFIKVAPLMSALAMVHGCTLILVHTGQHYDFEPVLQQERPAWVVGTDPCQILAAVDWVLAAGPVSHRLPPLWDGQTAPRIAHILTEAGGRL
jgi:hypothetical protein